jgi:predicted enzyme related to lactoylglutathione lyase
LNLVELWGFGGYDLSADQSFGDGQVNFDPGAVYRKWGAPQETLMKRIYLAVMAVTAVVLLASAARAQVTLNSVRVAAQDSVALAKFYEAAFGMFEINRITVPGGPEVFVNFGATSDAAKANKSEPIVIMHRDSDDVKDPIAHVILDVKNMTATVAAVKAAGGSMAGDPRPFGNTGIVIGIAIDPAGNRVEMIQRP